MQVGPVPPGLRDAHYAGAQKIGHGQGYRYPHDFAHGVVEQQYAPDAVASRRYYTPTQNGAERDLAVRAERLRALVRGEAPPP